LADIERYGLELLFGLELFGLELVELEDLLVEHSESSFQY
jgi:hypothetical protein